MTDLSVIVPTYQRRDSVLRLVGALSRQTLPADRFEVIVSIDGSNDGTQHALEALRSPLRLRAVWNENAGRAAACNRGARAARGDLLLFLDDDMEPSPACLARHAQLHAGRPRLGVLGAIPVARPPSPDPIIDFIGAKFDAFLEKIAQPDYELTFRDFYSSNFSIDRELFFSAGAFDEDFTVYGNEDGELAVRLLRSGVELVFAADAPAVQHYSKDFPALARDNLHKGQTAVILARKHPEEARHLKLAAYKRCSAKWALLRSLLLHSSRIWPRTPDAVIAVVQRFERRRRPHLDRIYRAALDYFFWLGVRSAV